MGKLYYFHAPTFEINPESAIAPKLGSIFANLDTLTSPLNQNDLITPSKNLTNISSLDDFNDTSKRNLEVQGGLNANVAQGFGSGNAIYTVGTDKSFIYRCETLDTIEFAANEEFVSESILNSIPVQSFLSKALIGRRKVYMVTGLKIATGFSKTASRETRHNPKLEFAADLTTLVGAPVTVGPQIDVNVVNSQTISHGKARNKIVFAYRVIRIKPKWDEFKWKLKSGGKYSVDDGKKEDKTVLEIEELDEDDILGEFPNAVMIETS